MARLAAVGVGVGAVMIATGAGCLSVPRSTETTAYCIGVHDNGGTYFLKAVYDEGEPSPCTSMAKVTKADFDRLALTRQCAKQQESPRRTLTYYANADEASVSAAQAMCATLVGMDVP